jgi:hypothetical protein
LAGALVWLLGPLLGALHLATVQHVVCPDDGELVDASEETGAARPAQASSREVSPPSSAPGHEHGHCANVLASRQRVLAPTPTASGFALAPAPEPSPRRWPALRRSAALYRVAPKSSPPRA